MSSLKGDNFIEQVKEAVLQKIDPPNISMHDVIIMSIKECVQMVQLKVRLMILLS